MADGLPLHDGARGEVSAISLGPRTCHLYLCAPRPRYHYADTCDSQGLQHNECTTQKGGRWRYCPGHRGRGYGALPMTMLNRPHRGIIVVDLDGTICEHRYPDFGEPIAGAKEALQRLKAAGFWIVIHTVRTSSAFQAAELYDPEVNSPEAVSAFLQRHGIPYDEIWMHDKPLAVAYIDDRSVRLVGNRSESNWHEIVDALVAREPRPTDLPRWLDRFLDKCASWKQGGREGGLWPSLLWRKRGSYFRE